MLKPILENSFSVQDIHKLREYHYEKTKNISSKERIKEINEKAEEFKNEMKKSKSKRIAI